MIDYQQQVRLVFETRIFFNGIFQQKDKDKRKQKINYGPIKNTLEKKIVKTDRLKPEVEFEIFFFSLIDLHLFQR